MRALVQASLAALLTANLASPANAQQAIPPGEKAVARVAAESGNDAAGEVMSLGSPNSRPAAGYSSANIQFTSEGGETTLSLAFGLDLESYNPPETDADYFSVSRTRLSFVASAPIEKGGKEAGLFASDSLVSGSKLKFSISRFSTKVGSGKGAGPELSLAYRNCVNRNAIAWAKGQSDPGTASAAAEDFAARKSSELAWKSDGVNFDRIMEAAAKDPGVGKFVANACHPGNGDLKDEYDLVKSYGGDAAGFRRRFLPDNAKLTFMGLDASMGRDDYSYLDRTNFKLLSQPRTSWEVGAYYGWIGSDLTSSLRARVVYGQSYKDKDEAEICRTVSVPAGDECIKGPDGAPIRERTGLASVEGRKLVTVDDKTQIAIAPQVTYRFEDKNVGVEVPIYLVPDKDGKLSGGIKAVYNSKGDEFAVGLFVGVPFSVFY
jgi:hypothetical protein